MDLSRVVFIYSDRRSYKIDFRSRHGLSQPSVEYIAEIWVGVSFHLYRYASSPIINKAERVAKDIIHACWAHVLTGSVVEEAPLPKQTQYLAFRNDASCVIAVLEDLLGMLLCVLP